MRQALRAAFGGRMGELATSQLPLQMNGMDGGMWGGMGMMMWLLMMVFWILVLLALAGGVYWLYSQLFGSSSDGSAGESAADATGESALEILDKRYAHGEIDEEEYVNRKKQITSEGEQ
ncbi:SHOCT domain-containing protein [Saliphagus infecundisoli]|uniref:SHOCT domain-containing protein n=1 Tax=Saliphagus infecundisoli TaxID=1849069 RepID=A0ABD5QHZ8_9EURY|nr:SHOCT domain-containing protein [Saliphagus infecundisoli]